MHRVARNGYFMSEAPPPTPSEDHEVNEAVSPAPDQATPSGSPERGYDPGTAYPQQAQPGYSYPPIYEQPPYLANDQQPGHVAPGPQPPDSDQPQAGYERPIFQQPTYQQPGHPPTYQQPAYQQPGYQQAGYQQPTASGPTFGYQTYLPTGASAEPGTGGSSGSEPDERASRGSRRGSTVLIAAVIAALVGGGVGAVTVATLDNGNRTVASGITVSTATAQNSAKVDGTVTAAAAKIAPSVVTINVAGQNESGTGSGVLLRSDGYILTNDHVVAVAGSGGTIQVITTDGQSANATIVGTDASDDLAVIKVNGLKNLAKATFAPSSALQVGQTVVAVGAPLGLSNSVTSGIVSNVARPVATGDSSSSSQAVFNAIQTDAAINPGNSGGPLVNLNGDVVGIDAAIASANSGGLQVPGQTQQSGSIGIGFAIPSDEASRIAAELITTGHATHAVLGVDVKDSGNQQSSIVTIGATISTVTANGAAAAAGLKTADVITKVDNQLIVESVDLVAAIRSHAPGQTVSITFHRGSETHVVKAKLGTATS
jgi:putative serine protease PepD